MDRNSMMVVIGVNMKLQLVLKTDSESSDENVNC